MLCRVRGRAGNAFNFDSFLGTGLCRSGKHTAAIPYARGATSSLRRLSNSAVPASWLAAGSG